MHWYTRRPTHRITDGNAVPGVYFPAFIRNGDYYLTDIVAYQDGMVDCWGLVTFEGFREKVREGWVVTSIPEGARVSIVNVCSFTAINVSVAGPEEELIKDVAAAIGEMNGRPTPQQRLIEAIKGLREQETPELQDRFRQAFADLPSYRRKYTFGSRMEKYTDLQRLLDDGEQEGRT